MNELKTFGARLRAARAVAKINQEELAKIVCSSKGYISELETNPDIRPSAELVLKLATETGTTVEYLMRGEAQQKAGADAVFFRSYETADEATKLKLQGILKLLKDK